MVMKGVRRWGAALATFLLLLGAAGCGRAAQSTPGTGQVQAPERRDTAPQIAQQPAPGNIQEKEQPAAGTGQAQQPAPVQAPAPTGQCAPMNEENAVGYLAQLSRLTPANRIAKARGQAADAFRMEAAAAEANWASWTNNWATAAWTKVETQEREGTVVLWVEYRAPGISGLPFAVFQLTCTAENNWVWSRYGDDQRDYRGLPEPVAGQNGVLTEEVAWEVIREYYGGLPGAIVFGTGKELERARLMEIQSRFEWDPKALTWTHPEAARVKLQPQGADKAIAILLDEQGAPTGENVTLMKAGGLWKVADHTINGAPAPEKPPKWSGFPSAGQEQHLLGVQLGATRADVQGLIGKPASVKNGKEYYAVRDFNVEYDAKGTVLRVTTYSGASARGVFIGAPASYVTALYGTPTQQSGNWIIYTDSTKSIKFQTVEVDGKDLVKAIVFERR